MLSSSFCDHVVVFLNWSGWCLVLLQLNFNWILRYFNPFHCEQKDMRQRGLEPTTIRLFHYVSTTGLGRGCWFCTLCQPFWLYQTSQVSSTHLTDKWATRPTRWQVGHFAIVPKLPKICAWPKNMRARGLEPTTVRLVHLVSTTGLGRGCWFCTLCPAFSMYQTTRWQLGPLSYS